MVRLPKELKYLKVVALVAAAIIYLGIKNLPFTNSAPMPAKEEGYYVERVVDGDTLKLSNKERVRLIGIDTPEVHYSDKLVRDSKKSGKDIKPYRRSEHRRPILQRSFVQVKKLGSSLML